MLFGLGGKDNEIIRKNNAVYFLFINAGLWGSTYVWSKLLLSYLPHFWILFLNSLGGLIITVFVFRYRFEKIKVRYILSSVAVSSMSVISNIFFIFALQYTSSANTAFIVQLSVIIAPIIMALIERRMPDRRIIMSAFTALFGLFLLTFDFGRDYKPAIGDLLAVGNALFFSFSLIGQKYNLKNVKPLQFTLIFHATNTILFFLLAITFDAWCITDVWRLDIDKMVQAPFIILVIANISVTVLTILFQSAAMKYVRPEKATIIYTLEPLIAAVLAFIFMGEKMEGINSFIGAALILASVVYSVLGSKELGSKENVEELP